MKHDDFFDSLRYGLVLDLDVGKKGVHIPIVDDPTTTYLGYCKHDIMATKAICESMEYNANKRMGCIEGCIKEVIFNNPATIVYWKDGTKTVVKCQEGETFDKEKGLAMAICKKIMNNKGNYNNQFHNILADAKVINDGPKPSTKEENIKKLDTVLDTIIEDIDSGLLT